MKKLLGLGLLVLASAAFAEEQNFPAGHPCQPLQAACYAQGYRVGMAKEGKGMHKNCMRPLRKGEQVPGVTVTPDQIQACNAKIAARKAASTPSGTTSH